MATVKQRLEELESVSRRRFVDADATVRSHALGKCMESLKNSIPSDEPKYIQLPHSTKLDYSGVVYHDKKCNALASLKVGELTLDDQNSLDALPIEALKTLGMSAKDFVMMIDDLLDSI